MLISMISSGVTGVVAKAGAARISGAAARVSTSPVPAGSSFSDELKAGGARHDAKASTTKDPFVQMESVFLRNFVESMLPKDDGGLFGSGIAGEYWRSLLAEQMADAIAVTGKLGIAETLRSRINKDNSQER